MTDDELLAGCLASDRRSWDVFVGRYSKLVYWSIEKTLAGSMLAKHPDVRDEIFQLVFEKILRRQELEKLRQTESLPKYVSIIAASVTRDKLKENQRCARRYAPLEGLDMGLDMLDAQVETLTDERLDTIRQTLSKLSAQEQSCVELCYADERTHREVGQILGLSQDTVSSILRRTKEKLRKALKDKGILGFEE